MDMAYSFYLRTSRLDLDDYNKEVEEGCHITMAGTWMSIVKVLRNAKTTLLIFLQKFQNNGKGVPLKSILETRL
jgi:maltose phosphorylase